MRTRSLLTLPLAVALALALPAVADARSVSSVHVTACKTGAKAKQRWATFTATMKAVDGSVRMGVHFDLIVERPGAPSGSSGQPLSNPQLDVWHRSHSGVTRYEYAQTVRKLSRGASYRMRVKFRWYDADGHVIKRTKHLSAACVQDGGRPNLIVPAVSIGAGAAPGTAAYSVSVQNVGKGVAEHFTVALFVDGALTDTREIDRLEPGEGAAVQLNGPTCRHLRAVVDFEQVVPETSEDDNSLRADC